MNNPSLRGTAATLVLAAAALGAGAPAAAQTLPPAAELLARYQEAIGGKAAFAGKNQMQATGTFTIPGTGMDGSFEAFSARPNKSALRVSIGGLGEIRSGFDGTVAWSMNPMEGPRLLDGREKTQAAEEADFESVLRDMSRLKSAETVESTRIGGRECYKVRLVWPSDRETFDCYSPETGLLVASISRQESNMGTADAVTLYDEYREFDGIRMATRITVQIMGIEQVLTFSSVSFGEVPADRFELPAEIRALIRQE
jgi:hypothetical protein